MSRPFAAPRAPAVLLALTVLAALAAGLLAADAQAAKKRFSIRGAGYGHGVGLSQYGTLGFAQQGRTYRVILRHYYTGTDIGRAEDRTVRVLLQSARGPASFTGATRAGDRELQPESVYQVTRLGSGRVVLRSDSGRELQTSDAPLRVTGGTVVLRGPAGNGVRNGRYRGALEFRPGNFAGVNAINAVTLEDYLRGVVPAEVPSGWPAEALKAQAVAARGYAITASVRGTGFDQYPDTRSQVYRGMATEAASTDAAIAATRGEIVTYAGRPVITYFFSTSGGETENVELSFLGAQPSPWLRGVDDPFDRVSPRHRWGPFRLTMAQADRKLGKLVKGSFRGIRVIRRGSSPRVVHAEVIGSRGRTRVTGATLRARLDLFDTWAYFRTITSGRARATPPPDTGGDSNPGEPLDPSGGAAFPRASAARAARSLAGSVIGASAGSRLLVQERRAGRWVRAGHTRLRAGGSYRAQVDHAGVYRVVSGGLPGPAVRLR